MMTSAERVISASFRVRECTTVTVASFPFCMRRRASGLPTIMLRPSTTTCAPLIATPLSRSSRKQPSGVQGTKPVDVAERELRDVDRVKAVDVFRRIERADDRRFIDLFGRR